MYKWSDKSKTRYSGVYKPLIKCATNALLKSKYDMKIPWRGGLRSVEEQLEIFNRGASSKDGIHNKSYHQSGYAIDIVPFGIDYDLDEIVKGKIIAPKEFRHFAMNMFNEWQKIIINNECNGILEWGGNWSNFIDVPHWQLKFNK